MNAIELKGKLKEELLLELGYEPSPAEICDKYEIPEKYIDWLHNTVPINDNTSLGNLILLSELTCKTGFWITEPNPKEVNKLTKETYQLLEDMRDKLSKELPELLNNLLQNVNGEPIQCELAVTNQPNFDWTRKELECMKRTEVAHVTKAGENIFETLGFEKEEAEELQRQSLAMTERRSKLYLDLANLINLKVGDKTDEELIDILHWSSDNVMNFREFVKTGHELLKLGKLLNVVLEIYGVDITKCFKVKVGIGAHIFGHKKLKRLSVDNAAHFLNWSKKDVRRLYTGRYTPIGKLSFNKLLNALIRLEDGDIDLVKFLPSEVFPSVYGSFK